MSYAKILYDEPLPLGLRDALLAMVVIMCLSWKSKTSIVDVYIFWGFLCCPFFHHRNIISNATNFFHVLIFFFRTSIGVKYNNSKFYSNSRCEGVSKNRRS
jgi:hypothetical protein